MSISSFECAYLLNTLFQTGTFTLPPISSNVGMIQVFHDQEGTFGLHPLVIETTGVDCFPNRNNQIILRHDGAHLTLIGGSDNIWYPISGNTYNDLVVSTLTIYSTIAFKLDGEVGVISADTDLRLLWNNFAFYTSSIVYFDWFSVSTAQISTLVVNELNANIFAANEVHAPVILQQQEVLFEEEPPPEP